MTWNIYFLNEKWYCDVYTFYFYKVLIDSENIFLEELDETDCVVVNTNYNINFDE